MIDNIFQNPIPQTPSPDIDIEVDIDLLFEQPKTAYNSEILTTQIDHTGTPTEGTPQRNRNVADQVEGEPQTHTSSLEQTSNPPLTTPNLTTPDFTTPSPNIQNNPDATFMGEPSNLFQEETTGEEQWDTENPIITTEENRLIKWTRNHPTDQIIGDPNSGIQTRAATANDCLFGAFLSMTEPKTIHTALKDPDWVKAMQEELAEFERNDVWNLVPTPPDVTIIGSRWVFRNKTDDQGVVCRNKARLVVKGYSQQEGIDYDETYALVARIEAIRIFLAYATHKNFKVFQMDVKCAFLHGELDREVYIQQPPGFEDPNFPHHSFRLQKAVYGLKQAPRAWYATLSTFLEESGFKRGSIDQTLFRKIYNKHLLIVQIYVDDIIFGSTDESLSVKFADLMKSKFEMSMIGEMTIFLGLQIKQSTDGIFINQENYVKNLLTRFSMDKSNTAKTPMAFGYKIDADLNGKPVDQKRYRGMIGSLLYLTASRPDIMFSTCLNAFTDSDYGGCKLDRKSTSGSCQFLGGRLVSWSSKKQSCVSTSTAEAEYVAAASCCSQVIWMQTQLRDYGFRVSQIPIFCDSTSAIAISHNPVHHSMTKHIDIRYHFIKDNIQKGHIELHFINTEDQIADVFTKALDETKCVSIAFKPKTDRPNLTSPKRRPSSKSSPFRSSPFSGAQNPSAAPDPEPAKPTRIHFSSHQIRAPDPAVRPTDPTQSPRVSDEIFTVLVPKLPKSY
ncbi:hypothetical protein L2E82_49218 [Cichorium intybus]|uniref:Uncharacterized protein n=1 Tax=Cichorium intybus TaxID=13427 RepID=A0ACB8YZ45_CICIN|nr:hypothetical protein L2E82_49218 [Cichorium intybus]